MPTIVENLWAVGAQIRPIAGGEGVAAPPQEPHLRSRPSALRPSPPPPNEKNPGHTLVRHSMQCNYDTADVTALCVEFHLRQSIEELFVKPRSAGSDP